jgi:triosephosphate isomerase
MRVPLVAGNWKMHLTRAGAATLAADVRVRVSAAGVEVVLCPPFPSLAAVAEALAGSPIALGAQDLHWEAAGPFTGEVSAEMLLDAGCRYVIVGHSERRVHFGESDADVNRKARAALRAGLRPIVCVGETLAERTAGKTEDVLARQLAGSLAGLADRLDHAVLAYEPVWAIGTGHNATAEQAQAAHRHIRETVREIAGAAVADAVRIQYGGSLKPDNAAAIFAGPDVDGGLVGGASLDAAAFARIVAAAG